MTIRVRSSFIGLLQRLSVNRSIFAISKGDLFYGNHMTRRQMELINVFNSLMLVKQSLHSVKNNYEDCSPTCVCNLETTCTLAEKQLHVAKSCLSSWLMVEADCYLPKNLEEYRIHGRK